MAPEDDVAPHLAGGEHLSSSSGLQGIGFDIGWTYASVAATGAVTLLVPAYAVRTVGPDAFGTLALVLAATAIATPLEAGVGLVARGAAAREASARNDDQRDAARARLVGTRKLSVLISATAATTALAVSVVARTVGADASVSALVLLIGGTVVVTSWSSTDQAVLMGRRQFRFLAETSLAGAAVTAGVVLLAAPAFGIVGIAAGLLSGTVVNRVLVRRSALARCPWLTARSDPAVDLKSTVRLVVPLVAVGIGGQVVATTDVFVIEALSTTAAVGIYRAASTLPTQLAALLFRGYDSVFPALAAGTRASQEHATQLLTKVFGYGAGIVFGTIAVNGAPIIEVFLGRQSSLGSAVVMLFSLVWLANFAAHGLALLMIARDRQRAFAPLVVVEAILNLALSVVLVRSVGAAGAAVATLLTLVVSNLLILPWATRSELSRGMTRRIIAVGAASSTCGAAIAVAVGVVVPATPSNALTVAMRAAVVLMAGSGIGVAAVGHEGRRELRGAFHRRAAEG